MTQTFGSSSGTTAINFFQSRYSIDQNLMAQVLEAALSRGGDFAELYFEHRYSGSLSFEDEKVRESSGGITQGVGIRVVQGDSVGYAYSEDFTLESMRHAARTAAQISASGQASSPVNATLDMLSAPDRYPISKPTVDVRALDKLEFIRRADKAARAYDSTVIKVNISFSDELKQIVIVSSDGRIAGDVQPMATMSVGVVTERDGQRQRGRKSVSGRVDMDLLFANHSPEDLAQTAARQAVTMLDAVEAPAGTLPVVLGAGWSGVLLHEAVGHGLEGDFNFKKQSNYSDRVGEMVASPLCTIVDEGTVPHSRGSLNVDDEGNVPTYNVLIENGQLAGYMQDRISSRHFDNKITGNGRRQSFRHSPMPRMTNTYMLAGESTFDEIIAAVPNGLYCVDYSGGQVNITNGDFVFGVTEAYLIQDGQITKPVKNVNLIGNGPDILSKVTMVGNDFKLADSGGTCGKNGQSVPVSLGMPSVLVSGITVGGTAAPATFSM